MKTSIFSLVFIALVSCFDFGVSVPPDIPINQLLAAPDTIIVEGRQLLLSTSMWRDFQPISPPDGKPLIAIIYITATDTAKLPPTMSSDAVWIVHNRQVWKSWFTGESIPPSEQKPNRLVKVARNAPKWGPGVFVDVIIRFNGRQNQIYFLRSPNQFIGRTD